MADTTPNLAKRCPSLGTVTGWTILFFVFLRVAIGWHLAYEGFWKLQQERWSADGYLQASSGPLRPIFLGFAEDPDGFERLEKEDIFARMDERMETAIEHYKLDDKQKAALEKYVERRKHGIKDAVDADNVELNIDAVFADPKFQERLDAYRTAVAEGQASEQDREEILNRIRAVFKDFDDVYIGNMVPKQAELAGDPPPPPPFVPANTSEPDDLYWLTEAAKEAALKKASKVQSGDPPSSEQLKELEKQYSYDWLQQRQQQLQSHFELTAEKVGKVNESERAQLEIDVGHQHQSATGWRYREQKKYGGKREELMPPPREKIFSVDSIFNDPSFQQQRDDYEKLCEQIKEREQFDSIEYAQERKIYDYQKKAAARGKLLAYFQGPFAPITHIDPKEMEQFHEWLGLELVLDNEKGTDQLAAGRMPLEPRSYKASFVSWGNILGLLIVGCCLMLGLFTRVSAVGGVCLLGMYYLSMPPWPGLPESPMAEGHYLIVNKNLIEIIALLMIAASGIGKWFGLDAIISAIANGGARDETERKQWTQEQKSESAAPHGA